MRKALIRLVILFSLSCLFSCKKNGEPEPVPVYESLYFPPVSGTGWETATAASLGWNEAELNNLYPYLQGKQTKAFIILHNGKIVAEKYFGTFTADSIWYWASAGKTMTAFLVGIAQQEGLLNISNPSAKYLGTGWTSAPPAKENLITVRNQLTMTTGLDDGVPDSDCTSPACLLYKADAGTRWAYHNAAYTLLYKVVEKASGVSYNAFFRQKVEAKTGINGIWRETPASNNVLHSSARSMARFGLLMLNKGKWDHTAVLSDTGYFNSQTSTSQQLNQSYGYLTWLNGKSSSMVPGLQTVFPVSLFPNAPADMYAALGKDDQKMYVVPSQKLVVVRMGNSAGGLSPAVSGFDNELWGKLKTIIRY